MSPSTVAAFADVLAALGVIASLLFLAFQVRQNTQAMRNQHWQAVVDRVMDNAARPVEQGAAATIAGGKADYRALDAAGQEAFSAWAFEFIVANDRNISFGKQGLLEPDVAAMGERNLAWFFNFPGARQWWRSKDRRPVPASFEVIIDEALARAETGGGAARAL